MVLNVFLGAGESTVRPWSPCESVPLKNIAPIQDHQLRGTMDSYSFTVPVPARWNVVKATLHFTYVNSSALIPRTSRLIFTVHDQTLAQVRLNPDTPEGEVTVPIPGALLKTGYNPCNFWISQHYTDEQCEDPFAPELLDWLNLGDAYLIFELEPVPVPKRVSAIADFLFVFLRTSLTPGSTLSSRS